MFEGIIDINNLNTLDLHGEYADISKVLIEEFINENYIMKNKYCVIIHGKGTNKIKKLTKEVLDSNVYVEEHKIYYYNDGCTIVKFKDGG